MKKYVVYDVHDQILQVLDQNPLFISPDTKLAVYDGDATNDRLYIENDQICVKVKPVEEVEPTHLTEYKKMKIGEADFLIETARSIVWSPLPIMNMVYNEKTQECLDYVSFNYPPDLTTYPFIQQECELSGKLSKDVADTILERRRQWIRTALKTEALRMACNISIKSATSISDIDLAISILKTQINDIE